MEFFSCYHCDQVTENLHQFALRTVFVYNMTLTDFDVLNVLNHNARIANHLNLKFKKLVSVLPYIERNSSLLLLIYSYQIYVNSYV